MRKYKSQPLGKGRGPRTKNENEEDSTFIQALLYLRELHGWEVLSHRPVVMASWEVVALETTIWLEAAWSRLAFKNETRGLRMEFSGSMII